MQIINSLFKTIAISGSLALALAAGVFSPSTALAGGNVSSYYETYRLNKVNSEKDLAAVKEGDLVVRTCPTCNAITAVRMPKSTKGNYELLSTKCEYCGANNVSVAAAPIRMAAFPKESVKR